MAWIDEISVNNFNKSFNLKNILTCSVFYPCAGIDASDIELLGDEALSYVHSDKSITEVDVLNALNNHFQPVGYNLIGLKKVALDEFHQFIFWGVFELRKDAKLGTGRQEYGCEPAHCIYEIGDGAVINVINVAECGECD